jgi:DNA excision repair protein ERCC-4
MSQVGDYIVTRDLCVERKSVSDLIGSLNSGRLHKQATAMMRNYARPVLLIEYEARDVARIPTERLQLLTMQFPRMRIIWSPSAHASAELLVELKAGHEEPSAEHALASHRYDTPLMREQFDTTLREVVMRLPGVTTKNLRRVLSRGGSLSQLLAMKEPELAELTGATAAGKSLHRALHVALAPNLQQNAGRPKKQPLKRNWPSKNTSKKPKN